MTYAKASPRHVVSEQYHGAPRPNEHSARRIPAKCATFKPGTQVTRKRDVGFVVDPKLRYA